jgi:hypothetical protein
MLVCRTPNGLLLVMANQTMITGHLRQCAIPRAAKLSWTILTIISAKASSTSTLGMRKP